MKNLETGEYPAFCARCGKKRVGGIGTNWVLDTNGEQESLKIRGRLTHTECPECRDKILESFENRGK